MNSKQAESGETKNNVNKVGMSSVSDLDPDPIKEVQKWLSYAEALELKYPNAIALASSSLDGQPSVRYVLLKRIDERGFIFFTNYESYKGRDFKKNPKAAFALYWQDLGKQLRVEGRIEKISEEESDEYFNSRPFGSRVSAVASDQSHELKSRENLEARMQELTEQYQEKENIPRPRSWGGYRIIPTRVELWQENNFRRHFRFEYFLDDQNLWKIRELQP